MTGSDGIDIQGARVRLGGRCVLDGIDLEAAERRIAFIGRNGSGKSTLGRLVKGLIRPESGRVTVHGMDPAARTPEAIGLVGFLFQNSDHQILCPTVIEEIRFGLVEAGHDTAEADRLSLELMRRHGVADWRDRPVAALSEGQRRLVCLLAVLVMAPRVLVLDEPFNGLDIPTRLKLAAFIADLPQQVVTIAHDPDAIESCDRVIWLHAGRIHRDGPPAAVLPPFLDAMRDTAAAERAQWSA